jgi:hypothetical protein
VSDGARHHVAHHLPRVLRALARIGNHPLPVELLERHTLLTACCDPAAQARRDAQQALELALQPADALDVELVDRLELRPARLRRHGPEAVQRRAHLLDLAPHALGVQLGADRNLDCHADTLLF